MLVKGNPPKTVGWKHSLFADDPGGTHEWNMGIYHNDANTDPYFINNSNQSHYILTPSVFQFLPQNNAFVQHTNGSFLSTLFTRLVDTTNNGLYPTTVANSIPVMTNFSQGPTVRHETAFDSNLAYAGGLATDKRIPKIRFAVSPFDGDRNIINATTLVQGFHSLPRQRGGNTLTVALVGAGSTLNWQADITTMAIDPYLESRPIIPPGEASTTTTNGNLSYNNNWFKTNSHIKFHSINSPLEAGKEITSTSIAFFKDFYQRGFAFTRADLKGISQQYLGANVSGTTMEIYFSSASPSSSSSVVFAGISFGQNGLPVVFGENQPARAARVLPNQIPASVLLQGGRAGRMMGIIDLGEVS